MKSDDKRRSLEIIYKILIFLTLLMLLQRIIPHSNIIPELLTSCEGRGIDHRTGGVRGIAPEPSYMAASMLSLWVCAVYLNGYRLKFGKHLIFALSILLTGSLLGIMGVAVNLLFIAFHQMKINLISLLRASVKREFLSFIIISVAAVVIITYWSPKALTRLFDFALDIVLGIQYTSLIQSIIRRKSICNLRD